MCFIFANYKTKRRSFLANLLLIIIMEGKKVGMNEREGGRESERER